MSTLSAPTRPTRLLSIDLLRGLTIGFMILVNDNADEAHAYWPLNHAYWNGFTPTDLVFPTFLFLVGITTVLSLSGRIAKGVARGTLFRHVLQRAVILFVLGLIVNSFPLFHIHTLRFYGVLPRIAICYFVVATFYLISPGWRSKVVAFVVALVGYWALMRFVPVPGYGVPNHTVPLLDRDGNLTAWIDRSIFSSRHLYEKTRDPEGLLSTIPAIGTTLLGMLTGLWLQAAHTLRRKTVGIVVAGISGVLLGGLWNITLPINKKLWTSSYVLFAGGLSLLLLALFLWLADITTGNRNDQESTQQRRSPLFMPLLVFGTNAITAYMISELLAAGIGFIHVPARSNPAAWLYLRYVHFFHDLAFSSLLYSLSFVAVCWIPVYFLYRRKIFIRI